MKYIFYVGGCYSAVGKGLASASTCFLMKQRGCSVQYIKFDPYLNSTSNSLSPIEHGESWLCDDGTVTDLDLGHVSRIAGIDLCKDNICTSGRLYKELLDNQDKYLGSSLQVIPHLTNAIIEKVEKLGKTSDLVVIEVGGTVSDIESDPYFEAMRQFKQKHSDNCLVAMVAPILWVPTIKEYKTKPLQNAVRSLQQFGLHVDLLFCRSQFNPPKEVINKICNLTNIPHESIIIANDVSTIYQVPINFYEQHLDDIIADKLRLKRTACRIHKYRDLVNKSMEAISQVNIGVVGKYANPDEAYLSLKEALYHAGAANNVKVNITWIDAEQIEKVEHYSFKGLNGIICPGGFDKRGIIGKLTAIKYARKNKIPFLGICLGLQCAVIEFARNVCKLDNANSLEFDEKTPYSVIHFVPGQENVKQKADTMRLGAYDCELKKDSLAYELYGKKIISERHRHRYEVNPEYIPILEKNGLKISGINPKSGLVEMVELPSHPYYIATQSHPEFKSRLTEPSPLFVGLVAAAKS